MHANECLVITDSVPRHPKIGIIQEEGAIKQQIHAVDSDPPAIM
jgi:hypothetical protein